MKRYITILLLICANLVLLSHVIIPHHHHYGVVVEMAFDGSGSIKINHNNSKGVEHQEKCNFFNVLPNNLFSYGIDYSSIGYIPLSAVIVYNAFQNIYSECLKVLHRPYLISYYSDYINLTNNLRGPPAF